MPYYDGYLLAVPNRNRQKYKDMAEEVWPLFRKHGALAMQENWGDDVPDGKVTSFPMATAKKDDESVVFSWVVWPDKETRDAGWKAMMEDPAMQQPANMPFDGMRMMWGGFAPLVSLSAD
jgi:uncharacterized protein YbaA (DUF1428 family)